MTNLNHTDKQAEPGTQKKDERPKLPVDETGEPVIIQDDPDIIPSPLRQITLSGYHIVISSNKIMY